MNLLLDTHVLLWAAGRPDLLSPRARSLIEDPDNQLLFSTLSIWEVSIKHSLGRTDFRVDAGVLRLKLIEAAYSEVTITSAHAIAVGSLPFIHKDPFDRLLVAQAIVEGLTLLTADGIVAKYPCAVQQV